MGNLYCNNNCCLQKKPTLYLEISEDGRKKDDEFVSLGRGKTMVMRSATILEGDENLHNKFPIDIDNKNNYNNIINSAAARLMDESIYRQLKNGLQFGAIVNSIIIDLNEKSIYDLLNFFFEKMCRYERQSQTEIQRNLSEYSKLSLTKLLLELNFIIHNTIKPLEKIHKHLNDALIIFVELFHYFVYQNESKQKLSVDYVHANSLYCNYNYWKNIRGIENYMKCKILMSLDLFGKIRNYFKPKGVKYDTTITIQKIKIVDKFLIDVFKAVS